MSTDNKIIDTAVSYGMPKMLAILIAGQARHESGNYSSKFFTRDNNPFGYMKDKNSKWQIERSVNKADNNAQIAEYASVENAVGELTSWIKRRQKDGKFPKDLNSIQTPEQYAQLLYNAKYFMGWKNASPAQNVANYAKGIQNGIKKFATGLTITEPEKKSLGIFSVLLITALVLTLTGVIKF